MKNTLLILLFGIVSLLHSASAQVLTNGQVYPWNPGVRGGIPYYPNSITVTGAVGNGIADDYQAITNAMRRTTNGGAVYLPAGTYRVNTEINFTYPTSIVIRGAGPSLTKIISYATSGGAGAINFGLDTSRTTAAYATNGYTFMSSNLTLTSVSGIATGQMARLLQTNDPAAIFGYSSQNYEQGELFIVTNISGNTITFDRPLSYTYGASFGPFVESFTKSTRYCGLEDLTVEMGTTNTTKFNPVYFRIANNCWLTNCVITNGVEDNVMISQCARISVVGSRLENHHTYTSASRYGVLLGEWTSDCLIEDNIIQGNNVAVIVQYGASGNVIGYNFSDRGFVHDGYGGVYPAPTDNSGGFFAGHGFNPRMNLFEGNVANGFGVDDTWGQNNNNTFHRNWATRFSYYNPTNFSLIANQGIFGIVNDATNWFQNYVGNIVGSPRDSNSVSTADIYIGVSRQHGNTFDGGYASNTCVFVGNFSWRTNGTYWPSGAPVTLTNSYYMSAKPGWFGTLGWPAIGPDVNTTATITNSAVIPAQARFLGQDYTTAFVTNNARSTRLRGWRGF